MQNVKNIWFNLSKKIRFLVIGGINTVVSYGFYILFCLMLGVSKYQIALILAWIFSSFISFTTQKLFVFQSKGNWYKEYTKCCAIWGISYLQNALFLELNIKLLNINVFIAQIISTLCVTIFTYILFKKFAFKPIS